MITVALKGQTSNPAFSAASVLYSVSLTWTTKTFTLYVQLRLYVIICLRKLNPLLDSHQDVKKNVPSLLLALVNMILEGPSIQDHSDATTPAALSIAQLLKFSSVKHKRKQTTATVWHSIDQETPVPTYIGLMLPVHTRKRDLVDRLYGLGMSVSYDRVLHLSAQMGNDVCEQFHREHVVCPPKLRYHVFTSSAVDNVDHNPTSSTSKDAFHGTAISLIQHPAYNGAGEDRSISVGVAPCSKSVGNLPQFYTDVPPVTGRIKNIPVPATTLSSLKRESYKQQTENDYLWLDHTRRALEGENQCLENISWAAYHASRQ